MDIFWNHTILFAKMMDLITDPKTGVVVLKPAYV